MTKRTPKDISNVISDLSGLAGVMETHEGDAITITKEDVQTVFDALEVLEQAKQALWLTQHL